jgi:formylmethanofuran dehydrogenase subunit E
VKPDSADGKTINPPADLARVVEFHGHLCPGLLIGYRAAKAGLSRLAAARSQDEELIAIVENNSCAVDAVQVLTGATFGKGNLFFRDYGKQVFTFALRPGGRAVRVALKADAFGPGEISRDERARMLLDLDDDRLLAIEEQTITLPAEAEIHKSLVCAQCGEPVMATRTREVSGRRLCIPCAEKTPR